MKSSTASVIRVIAILVYLGSFILGIVLGIKVVEVGYYKTSTSTMFLFETALGYWCAGFAFGTVLLGISQIIQKLDNVERLLRGEVVESRNNVQDYSTSQSSQTNNSAPQNYSQPSNTYQDYSAPNNSQNN